MRMENVTHAKVKPIEDVRYANRKAISKGKEGWREERAEAEAEEGDEEKEERGPRVVAGTRG